MDLTARCYNRQAGGLRKASGLAFSALLPRDFIGQRTRTPLRLGTVPREIAAVRAHAKTLTKLLSNRLWAEHDCRILQQVQRRVAENVHSKTALLESRFRSSAPPLDIALDWIGPVAHRMAVCSLLVGDWFLAQYACNYFASTSCRVGSPTSTLPAALPSSLKGCASTVGTKSGLYI